MRAERKFLSITIQRRWVCVCRFFSPSHIHLLVWVVLDHFSGLKIGSKTRVVDSPKTKKTTRETHGKKKFKYTYRYDKHTVYTGTQIQMAFLAFCFHRWFERIRRSFSVCCVDSHRAEPFSFAGIFLCYSVVGFIGLLVFLLFFINIAWCRACVYCSFFIPFEFMFENDRDIVVVFVCVSLTVCV